MPSDRTPESRPGDFNAWSDEILRLAVFEPGKWTARSLSERFNVPCGTMKNRVGHLRAVGYIQRYIRLIKATDEGRVAYHERINKL